MPTTASVVISSNGPASGNRGGNRVKPLKRVNTRDLSRELRRTTTQELQRSSTLELQKSPNQSRVEAPDSSATERAHQEDDDLATAFGGAPARSKTKRGKQVHPSNDITVASGGSSFRRGSFRVAKAAAKVSLADTVVEKRMQAKKPWFVIDPRSSKAMQRWDIVTGVRACKGAGEPHSILDWNPLDCI